MTVLAVTDLWGVTRNPWNLDLSPCGSSGWAGAAFTAGMTTLADGSDSPGSDHVRTGISELRRCGPERGLLWCRATRRVLSPAVVTGSGSASARHPALTWVNT